MGGDGDGGNGDGDGDGDGSNNRVMVQWYPGHIAKAERQIRETFRVVDVVVEVRDARAPSITSHGKVGEWCAGRPRIVVFTHSDQIPSSSKRMWASSYSNANTNTNANANAATATTTHHRNDQNDRGVGIGIGGASRYDHPLSPEVRNQAKQYMEWRKRYERDDIPPRDKKNNNDDDDDDDDDSMTSSSSSSSSSSSNGMSHHPYYYPVEAVLFVDAKLGKGIPNLIRTIERAGRSVQRRRSHRGLKERPLRVGIMGYPNVGKSALINRILGRKRARSANRPGITRSLQWIRVRRHRHPYIDHESGGGGGDSADARGVMSSTTTTTVGGRKKRRRRRTTDEFELLDSPGVIPARIDDQKDALLLAAINCIGEASYDNQGAAAHLCQTLLDFHTPPKKKNKNDDDEYDDNIDRGYVTCPDWPRFCLERYGFDPVVTLVKEEEEAEEGTSRHCQKMETGSNDDDDDAKDDANKSDDHHRTPIRMKSTKTTGMTGEDMLYRIADRHCRGSPEDAARKILQDFRTGRVGKICLEMPPPSSSSLTSRRRRHHHHHQTKEHEGRDHHDDENGETYDDVDEEFSERLERAHVALEKAKNVGLELPSFIIHHDDDHHHHDDDDDDDDDDEKKNVNEKDVIQQNNDKNNDDNSNNNNNKKDNPSSVTVDQYDVGKGLFDGW